jgi:hypothetical protein
MDPGVASCFRSLPCLVSGRPGSRTRAEPGPRQRRRQASLRRLSAIPIMGRRERAVFGCVPAPRCSLESGRRLAAVIPSGFPRFPAAGAWGGPRRAAGSIRAAAAPPGGGGQTCGRSRAARVRACSPGLGERAAGGGQGPDLPVAHRVEDAGEQLAGRGGLGDVLRLLAAAGGDAVPELAGRARGGLVPIASTVAHRRAGEPCLACARGRP